MSVNWDIAKRFAVALTKSRQQIQYELHSEMFVTRCRMMGATEDQGVQLLNEAVRAAQESFEQNWTFVQDVTDRMQVMLSRGDEFGQVLEWIKACPAELEMTRIAELVIPGMWPGGPGRLT